MSERFLFANGLRFRYLDWEGSGSDLIFVHPTGFVADIWAPFAARLQDRCRCVALDTRGHGDSDKPGDYHAQRLVEDLQAFISAAGLQRPIGVGHSMGASVIAALEANNPGALRAAVLIEPVLTYDVPPGQHTPEQARLAAGTQKRRAVWPSRQEVYDSYRARPPFQTWDEEILRQYVEHGFAEHPNGGAAGSVELKCTPETEAGMYLSDHPWLLSEEKLRRVRCPVLILHAQESLALSAADAVRTAALLPDSRLATLPGGHFAPFEHPRLAEQAILGFLDGLDLPAAAGSTTDPSSELASDR